MEVDEGNAHIGRKVVEARGKAGMTQTELAKRIGILRSSVANIEAGRQGLSATRLAVLAAVFGTSMEWFLPPVKLPDEPPVPHNVTVKRFFRVWCETCETVIADDATDRSAAFGQRADHIAARQAAEARDGQ